MKEKIKEGLNKAKKAGSVAWYNIKPWIFAEDSFDRIKQVFAEDSRESRQILFTWFFWTFLIAFILGALVSCSTLEEEWDMTKQELQAEGEQEEAKKRAVEIIASPEFQRIANPYLFEGKGSVEDTKFQYGARGMWIPSQELRDEFFKRNPKAKTARKELQWLFMGLHELGFDFVAYEAYRSCERQKELYRLKKTKVKTCTGMHNRNPSHAIDVVSLRKGKALWADKVQFATLAGVAHQLHCSLASQHGWSAGYRWGGKWRFRTDRDVGERDGRFVDMPHHEISEKHPMDCLLTSSQFIDKTDTDVAAEFDKAFKTLEGK